MTSPDPLPTELAAAHAMILAERAGRRAAEARAKSAEAEISDARLEIEHLKLLLAKARREQYGQSSGRGAKIIAQLELQLAELEETVAQEEMAAEIATPPASGTGSRACSSIEGLDQPAFVYFRTLSLQQPDLSTRDSSGLVRNFIAERCALPCSGITLELGSNGVGQRLAQ